MSEEAGNDVRSLALVNPDVNRFERFKSGEPEEAIAATDNLSIERVRSSIATGERFLKANQQIRLNELRFESAIDNESLRKTIRQSLGPKLVKALDKLLEGERLIVERDKATGTVKIHREVDPEILSMGVEQYQKAVSMLEKPAPSTVINLQQNNVSGQEAPRMARMSYEERMDRIRRQQQAVVLDSQTVQAEPSAEAGPVSGPILEDAEAEAPKEDAWKF